MEGGQSVGSAVTYSAGAGKQNGTVKNANAVFAKANMAALPTLKGCVWFACSGKHPVMSSLRSAVVPSYNEPEIYTSLDFPSTRGSKFALFELSIHEVLDFPRLGEALYLHL